MPLHASLYVLQVACSRQLALLHNNGDHQETAALGRHLLCPPLCHPGDYTFEIFVAILTRSLPLLACCCLENVICMREESSHPDWIAWNWATKQPYQQCPSAMLHFGTFCGFASILLQATHVSFDRLPQQKGIYKLKGFQIEHWLSNPTGHVWQVQLTQHSIP